MLYGEADRTADSGKCDLLWNGSDGWDGLIMVRGYREGSDIFLEVSDNGLGMPEEAAQDC